MIRSFALVVAGALVLSACSQGGQKSDPNDPYAGLDAQILSWRTDIETNHPVCSTKIEGKGCEGFAVRCKAAQTITPEEQAKGVTAKIVSAITFSGRMEDGSTGKSGSAFAYFSKTGDAWTRTEARPVNPSTCAPL